MQGRQAVWVPGVDPIQVQFINGRGTKPRFGCWKVGHGQDDQATVDIVRLQLVDQFGQRDLPFVFITVGTGHQQYGGPLTVANTDDRNGQPAVSRAVN